MRHGSLRSAAFTCLLASVVCVLFTCKPGSKPGVVASSGPQVKATVVTITTVLQPQTRTFTHTVVIAGNRARSGDELDHWRLFDLSKNEVTFVDDIAKTYRRASLKSLRDTRQALDAQPLPDTLPRAQFNVTSNTRTLLGVPAKQSVVRLGAYQRQLWVATHPLIPSGLFAMMEASRQTTSPASGVMRDVDAALFDVRGFPFAEHTELPYGNERMVLDRTVTKIERRNVAESWLNVRADYKDVTPRGKEAGTTTQ